MFKYFLLDFMIYVVLTQARGDEIEVCLPSWTKKEGIHSSDGDFIGNKSLLECLTHCELDGACMAVDFIQIDNSCWSHSDPEYDSLERTFENIETSQYTLNRSCDAIKVSIEDCPSSWKSLTDKSSTSNYSTLGFANFSSCFTYCRFTNSCYGFVFDNSTWPFCKIFTNVNFADPEYLVEISSSVIYYLNKNECYAQNKSNKIYARCMGQTFPEVSQWCPSSTSINIISQNFTDNPFCCEDGVQTPLGVTPLYNDRLPSIKIEYLRKNYSTIINACISNHSCVLKAETDGFQYKSDFCTLDGPNSVTIAFKCIGNTVNTSSMSSPTASSPPFTSFAIYTFNQNSSTSVIPSSTLTALTQDLFPPSHSSFSSTLFPSSSSLSLEVNMSISTKYDDSISPSGSFKMEISNFATQSSTAIQPLTTSNESNPPTSTEIKYDSTPLPFLFSLSSSSPILSTDYYLATSLKFNPSSSPSSEIPIPSDPTNPFSSSKSFQTSASYSTINPESPEKYENKRTALVLGALGLTFGLLSLLLILFIILLLLIYLRGNEKVFGKAFNVSWKTLHGSSIA